jgi:NADH-quinone oxidoreductase subunit N
MTLLAGYSLFPEIFLSISILFQLIFNSYLVTSIKYNAPLISLETFYQTLFILICLLLLLLNYKFEVFFSNFIFVNDLNTTDIKIFLIISCIFLLFTIIYNFKTQNLNFFEYFTLFLLSIFALLLLISSCDMISVYLVIEMQALSFYTLSSFRRNSAVSTESGLKYFISGSFFSGIFLLGCSLLYLCLGSLNLNSIQILLYIFFDDQNLNLYFFLVIAVIFITVTFLFKLSVAPFHFWSPDVYEGAPLASTAIFSVIPKIALLSFFIKWLSILDVVFPEIFNLLLFLGFFSLFFGAFFAVQQKRLKRLFIYSSISQIGYIVIALSSNTLNSLISVYFFLIIYILTSLLIWSNFSLFYNFQSRVNIFFKKPFSPLYISSISNFFKFNKIWSFSFLLIFFSIAGIPPLSGFLAKILILFSVIEYNLSFISISLVLVSSISAFYYLRIIKTVFFESQNILLRKEDSQIIFNNSSLLFINCIVISFILLLVIYLFIYPSLIILISYHIVIASLFF